MYNTQEHNKFIYTFRQLYTIVNKDRTRTSNNTKNL